MPDPRTTPPSVAPPHTPNVVKRNRFVGWLRYRSWTVLAGAALLMFGLVNLYPFAWMAGTSLKAKSEAATERMEVLPRTKYELAEHLRRDVREVLSDLQAGAWAEQFKTHVRSLETDSQIDAAIEENVIAISDWLQGFNNDTDLPRRSEAYRVRVAELLDASAPRRGELALTDPQVQTITYWIVHDEAMAIPGGFHERQIRALLDLVKPTADPKGIAPKDYSASYQCDLPTAETELADLARRGLVEPVNDTGRYRATDKAEGELYAGLNARQILILIGRRREDLANRQNRAIFVPDRISVADYAENFGIKPELAAKDLQGLESKGFMQPVVWQWENYKTVLFDPATRFDLRFLTSMAITVSVVFLTVMMSSMLGYALARLKFPGKIFVLFLLLGGAVAPREAIMIPIFRMLQAVGLIENLWGVVLWLSGVAIGNSILMAGFFLTLPREVEEAATVDGAGPFRTFFDVALPMARPIVMTVGLFAFLSAWNDFMIPLVCTQGRDELRPLAVAVYTLQQGAAGLWHEFNAAAAIMIVPVVVIFLLLQRHIIKAIAVGAVKG